jgi:hypothetical protein
MAITYHVASGPNSGEYSVVRVNDSGPTYAVMATCGVEADASSIVTALS